MGTFTMTHDDLWKRLIEMPDYAWRIAKHTYIQFVFDGLGKVAKNEEGIPLINQDIGVLYFETYIMIYKPNGDIALFGGWRKPTTAKRINQGLPPDASIEGIGSSWYLKTLKGKFTFEDGMILHPDGSVKYKPQSMIDTGVIDSHGDPIRIGDTITIKESD